MESELRTELRSERGIKLLFQEVGARPWFLVRRNVLARGTYNRPGGDDRSSGKQILAGAQWRLNFLISSGGFSANQAVFGSNSVDLHAW